MIDLVNRLADCVADNGYDVFVQQMSNGYVFNIVHQATDREAVYGFNAASYFDVCSRIASQYCTHDQLNALADQGADWVAIQATEGGMLRQVA
ncbi:MAG: hypothetical protein AAGC44_08895 [Planctomycetota bacterium]